MVCAQLVYGSVQRSDRTSLLPLHTCTRVVIIISIHCHSRVLPSGMNVRKSWPGSVVCCYLRPNPRVLIHTPSVGMTKAQEMTIVRGIATQCCEQPLPEQWIEIVGARVCMQSARLCLAALEQC